MISNVFTDVITKISKTRIKMQLKREKHLGELEFYRGILQVNSLNHDGG